MFACEEGKGGGERPIEKTSSYERGRFIFRTFSLLVLKVFVWNCNKYYIRASCASVIVISLWRVSFSTSNKYCKILAGTFPFLSSTNNSVNRLYADADTRCYCWLVFEALGRGFSSFCRFSLPILFYSSCSCV